MKISFLRSSAIAAVTFGVVVLGSISGVDASGQQNKQKRAATKPVAAETTQPIAGDAGSVTQAPATAENVLSTTGAPKAGSKKVAAKTASAAPSGPSRGFTATAYSLRGRMANGTPVHRGAIAADPRVLPLGTRVYLSAGSLSGEYVVKDTGGAIKGRRIDIWVPSRGQAMNFGRRSIQLTVLSGRRATSGAAKVNTKTKGATTNAQSNAASATENRK